MGVGGSVGVDSLAVVSDLGDVAGVVVHVVVDVLDPAVREGHRVGALGLACAVAGLGGVEVGLGVVVGDGVVVGVGGDLVGVHLGGVVGRGGMGNSMDSRGVVGRGSVHNGGSMVSRGSVNNGGSVVSRGSVVDSMVGNGGSVVGRSNNGMAGTVVGTVDSMDSSLAEVGSHTVGGSVGHRVVAGVGGDGGAKGLGLGVGPDLH